MYLILLLALLGILTSCKKNESESQLSVITVETLAQELKIPKVVMSRVEESLFADSKSIVPIYTFIPLSVMLTEVNESVLSQPQIRYNFPKGGGLLDLKDIVRGQGSFYLSFPEDQFNTDYEVMNIYYVSNSPEREIEGKKFGMGCGRMTDLKTQFRKLQKQDFLKLNTNGLRYLSVVAGHYIFIFRKNNQVSISQLTLTDSRYQSELCIGDLPL